MSLDFDFPTFLAPEQLDTLLAKGWFRMRENIFTTHYYIRDSFLLSTVWLRSDLSNYRFSKSQRKHLRNIHRRYTVTFRPLVLTPEQEALYQLYLTVAEGERSATLVNVLGESNPDVFNSQLLEIRDPEAGNRLVALSVFDIGHRALQSIIGIYHPDYAHESFGVYTMLLEVEFAKEQNFLWYYIGYFTPGFSTFDYKLRLDALSFFDPDKEAWFPIETLERPKLWSNQQISRLQAVKEFLGERNLPSTIVLNVFYDTIILHALGNAYLDEPLFLDMRFNSSTRVGHLCYFSIQDQCYRLFLVDFEARRAKKHKGMDVLEGGWPIHGSLIRKTHFIAEASSPEELLKDVVET